MFPFAHNKIVGAFLLSTYLVVGRITRRYNVCSFRDGCFGKNDKGMQKTLVVIFTDGYDKSNHHPCVVGIFLIKNYF